MVFLWKLLHNLKCSLKYVTYALLFLLSFILLHIWSLRYKVNKYDVLPGIRVFSYNGKTSSFLAPKYILLWQKYSLMINHRGEQIFPSLQCKVNNCIFTEDKALLDGDYTRFDALLFNEGALKINTSRPERRAQSQIYIFTTIESAYYQPACELFTDNFFNWTFTYRLDSDLLWSYFIVRNVTGHMVAPSMHVKWKIKTSNISAGIKDILSHKTKAAAWLVSNCNADNSRDEYISRLQEHLYHFSLKIDVFGDCSQRKCLYDDCEEMFSKHYYFYLAFENSFSKDYVTEKVLHGYNNYVVPIVYGGANYTRFLPPGSYLNARDHHPYNLAYIMHEAMKSPAKYEQFFAWTNYYTIDSHLPGYHPLCDLCEALNSKTVHKRTYRRFRIWWNGVNGMKWCLSQAFWNETSLVNLNGRHILQIY